MIKLAYIIVGGLKDAFSDDTVRSLLAFTTLLIAVATLIFAYLEGWKLIDAAFFEVVPPFWTVLQLF